MPDSLLNVLKFFLVALIWLFFLRAFRAVWVEVRQHSDFSSGDGAQALPSSILKSGFSQNIAGEAQIIKKSNVPTLLLSVTVPPEMAGSVYEISGAESIIGRASGCAVPIQDDTFVSHLHARIFTRGAEFWIEDLGSTNGSFVNGKKLVSPVPLRDADKVQIGRTTFEVSR